MYVYIYMQETPPGGYHFRRQDVEKQSERRKARAKKAEKRKKKNLERRTTPTNLFLGHFYYKTGENVFFGIKGTHQVGSPPSTYICICIYRYTYTHIHTNWR